MIRCKFRLAFTLAAVGMCAVAVSPAKASTILYTAAVDISGGSDPTSVPATPAANPHIPSVDPSVTLTPSTADLDGVATGPINGNTYGPGAFGGSTGGSTGWVHVSYVVTTDDLGQPLFVEVANVGDTSFTSGLAVDNISINGATVEGFEGGVPGSFTTNGFVITSGAVTNLSPTEGSSFLYMDTTGTAAPIFDQIDGTTGANFITLLGLAVGDLLEFDINFMTRDGTSTYHDYALASLGVTSVTAVPEPSSLMLVGLGIVGLASRRLRRKAVK